MIILMWRAVLVAFVGGIQNAMHKYKNCAGALCLALGLAACGTEAPAVTDPVQARASIQQSLDHLEALKLVSGETLVLELPEQATECYGAPCPGTEWVEIYNAELFRQAPRIAQLADIAEAVSADSTVAPSLMSERAAAVAALSALQVISIGSLIEDQPANNPECYNLPCESDILAAQHANELRVGRAFAIASRARGL
jgi:hypothetical protein